MDTLQALIFDVDGTLADTEREGHRVAFNKAFKEADLDWHWSSDLYAELLAVTGGKERIRFFISDFLGLEQLPTSSDKTEEGLQAMALSLHKRKTHFYLHMLEKGDIPLRTGVEALIRGAKEAGYRLAIATTTTPANVSYLISATLGKEALDWFEVIAAGDIVPAKKPAPDIYTYALEKMNLSPKNAIAFEDSENGIRSSLGAQLKTIITTNSYTIDHDFTGAALVVDAIGSPEQPFTVIKGDVQAHNHLNIALVETIFNQQ